ncbi:unnamed protein product, partial [Laminaria digitata]
LGSDDGDDDFALPQPSEPQRKKSTRKEREYYPREKSGAFALLAQLWLFEQEGTASAEIATLKSGAQRFSKDPMHTASGPHVTAASNYCAWSGMTTLERKALVERNTKGGKRHTFRLSAEGRELAARIVQDHPDIFGDSYDDPDAPDEDDLQPPPPPPSQGLPTGSPPGPHATGSVPPGRGAACALKGRVSVANPYLRTASTRVGATRQSVTSVWTGRVSGGGGGASVTISGGGSGSRIGSSSGSGIDSGSGNGRGSEGGGKTKTALAAEARRAREIASSEIVASARLVTVPKSMVGGAAAKK